MKRIRKRTSARKGKTAAWRRKEGQNPKGGLNAKGRASYKRETGGTLKAPVKSGTNPRRVSFAARFAGMKGPMKDSKGRPTRKALALKAWGFGSVEAARNFANRHKKSKQENIMPGKKGYKKMSKPKKAKPRMPKGKKKLY